MEGIALILLVIFGYSIAQSAMRSADKRRADTVRLLEEALRNPQVDRQTVDQLARQLTGKAADAAAGKPAADQGLGFLGNLFLVLGWFGLFTAGGLGIGGNYVDDRTVERDLIMAAWIVALVSFGCLTYPFALREARARVQRT
ncbi:MAG: hypothetical protein INH34_18365 [Phycisphaerales bacterium]|jgi:hypothetical protein|nr:hypothetical protein [Phycisphaerales bacterium]